MTFRSTFAIVLALSGVACTHLPAARPAPQTVRTVTVFPANNRTGDPLLIAGASFTEKYLLPTERFTVADALAAEARTQLADRGVTVLPTPVDTAGGGRTPSSAQDAAALAVAEHVDGLAVYIEIRRWEADGPYHPTFVIASVTVALVDPSSGRVVWSANHASRPVPTPGVISLGDAYAVAAHTLMKEMLAPLAAAPPTF